MEMIRLPCISCGNTDIPKFIRIRKYKSISKKCILCYREDERARSLRYYHRNRISCLERSNAWRINNRERYNELVNNHYHKYVSNVMKHIPEGI